MALPWRQVAQKPEYMNLSPEKKQEVQDDYFNAVVVPKLGDKNKDDIYKEFKTFTTSLDTPTPKQPETGIGSDMLSGLSRAGGVAVGTALAVPSFVWGSQQEQYKHPEEFQKLSTIEQVNAAGFGGLQTAWKGITEKGNWGALWGDYYKSVRGGKSVADDLPDGLKWAAPTLEVIMDIATDPSVSGPAIFGKLLKGMPKNIAKKFPALKEELDQLSKLNKAKRELVIGTAQKKVNEIQKAKETFKGTPFGNLITKASKDREGTSYAKWWSQSLDEAEKKSSWVKDKDTYQAWWERGGEGRTGMKGSPLMEPGWNVKKDVPKKHWEETLYRGTKTGTGRGKSWTPQKDYAKAYGDKVIESKLKTDANVLDLTVNQGDAFPDQPWVTDHSSPLYKKYMQSYNRRYDPAPFNLKFDKIKKDGYDAVVFGDDGSVEIRVLNDNALKKVTSKISDIKPTKKEVPELSKKLEALRGVYKGTDTDQVVKGLKAEAGTQGFAKQKGISQSKQMPEKEIAKRQQEQTLSNLNQYREKQGLTPYTEKDLYKAKTRVNRGNTATVKATGGSVLGIEEDENGNLTYDFKKGLLGAVGGSIAMKGVGKRKALKTIANNPAWAKVHGMVGKNKVGFGDFIGVFGKFMPNWIDRFSKIAKVSPRAYESARKFNSYKDITSQKFNKLKEGFSNVRGDEVLLTDYITAHRAKTRAERGLKNPNGVTLTDAKSSIQEMEQHYKSMGKDPEELKMALNIFQDWGDKYILREAVDAGVLSEKQYKAIKANNEWYATFDVLDYMPPDFNKQIGVTGEYFSRANQDVVKKMIGTEKKIADPIEATIKKFASAQGFYAQNKVASALIDDPLTKGMFKKIKAGDTVPKGFDTINRFKDGKVERWLVDEEIGRAMKQLTPWQVPKVIGGLNDIFRKSATTLYLPFSISNAMRDAFMAYTTSGAYRSKDLGRFAGDWFKGLKEGFKSEFLGNSKVVDEYLKHGGGFGFSGQFRDAKAAKKMLFKQGLSPKDIIKSPLTLIEKLTSTVELAPRLAIQQRALKTGKTLDQASMMAREGTIDFNKAGVYTKVINQFVPFLSARVGGRVQVGKALIKDPKNTFAKAFTSTVVPGFGLWAYNRLYYSDLYDDIPEHIKQNYFTFITGETKDKQGRTVPKYFVISKGDIGQMAWNPIEYGLDNMLKKDPESMKKFLINYANDLSPVEFARDGELSGTKALSGITPPAAKGVVEDIAGKSLYTGNKITPRKFENIPQKELHYKEGTPELYKKMAVALKDVPLIPDTFKSPLRAQNFFSNLLAGYGREGLSPEAMLRGLTGRLVKTTGGANRNKATEAFFDISVGYKTAMASAKELIKNGDKQGARKLLLQWNKGLNKQVKEYNSKFKKHGYGDKGGIRSKFSFTPKKFKNMFMGRVDKRDYLQKKLSRR